MPSIRLADIPNAGPQGVAPDTGILAPRVAQLGGAAALDPNAMRGVAKDMQLETYNLNAFAGEAIGMGKIADGVGDAATLGIRFANKMAEAKENDDHIRADTLMRIALEKQANDQDTTPVEKWQEKWASNVADTRKKISEIGMSKNTFAQLSPTMDRWAELSKVKIEGQANQKRIEGYRMNTKANALKKMADDDYEGAFAVIDEGVKKGVFSEEQGKLEKAMMQDDIIRKAELKQRENITSEILTDPRRAKEILTKAKTGEQTEFGKLDPSRVKLHLYEADRQIRVTDSDNWNSLVERIQNGDIASKEDLKKEAEGKQIDPGKYKRLESAIAANIRFDPKVAGDLKAKVAGFDFSADKDDEEFYALNAEIAAKLPKEHAQLLAGELNSSWKKAFDGTPKSPREVYRSDVIQDIKRMGDSGLLGETGLDKDGKIIEQSKYNAYKATVYSVMQGMDDWFNNPANKDKTPEDAFSYRDGLIKPKLNDAAKKLWEAQKTPATTSVFGKTMYELATGDDFKANLSGNLVDWVKNLEARPNEKQSSKFTSYQDGKQISVGYGTRSSKLGEQISESEADSRLREELATHAKNIDSAVSEKGYKLTKGQRDALISFDFNTGDGAKLIKSSQSLEEIKTRMPSWNKITKDGVKIESEGLNNRRNQELQKWNS